MSKSLLSLKTVSPKRPALENKEGGEGGGEEERVGRGKAIRV